MEKYNFYCEEWTGPRFERKRTKIFGIEERDMVSMIERMESEYPDLGWSGASNESTPGKPYRIRVWGVSDNMSVDCIWNWNGSKKFW